MKTDEDYPSSFEDFEWLNHYAPRFQVDSNDIEVLKTPTEFYNYLKDSLSKSTKRIVLSSLYFGTGSLEQDLVNVIEAKLSKCSQLKCKILLDYSRGLRGEVNSKTIFQGLTTKYKQQFHLYLYHNPNLRGMTKKYMPERVNETIGVQHMKIYICDDNLIISGANLSNDYFVNRQDRYVVIKNCPKLCDFFEELTDAISEFSFKAKENGSVEYSNDYHPFNGDLEDFSQQLSSRVKSLLDKSVNINRTENAIAVKATAAAVSDTAAYVYPLIQIHDSNVLVDELVTKKFFQYSPSLSKMQLAVGYFNLIEDYENLIVLNSKAEYNILVSSPKANGFFNSHGFSRNIPKIYSHLEENFYRFIKSKEQDKRIRMYEYERDGWTFHAKGLWYYGINETKPALTIVGSSNFGYRSVYRDLEAQLVIHSRNTKFRNDLHKEQEDLFKISNLVTNETFIPEIRQIPVYLRLLTRILKSYF